MQKGTVLILLLLCVAFLLPACRGYQQNLGDLGTGDSNRHFDMGSRKMETSASSVFTVVIDPGHGGRDVGTIGASGRYEKDFTLSLARRVLERLEHEPGIQAVMTRTDDSFISQQSLYRPAYANALNADVLISLHGNSYSDPSVSGTETLYYHTHSRHLAQLMQQHVTAATGFRNRGIKRKDLFVLREARMPAVLIEVGYMTNPEDESLMWSDVFQRRVAAAIVEAIREYLAENRSSQPD